MKARVWTGRETLASINGSVIGDTFEDFERWLTKQPDGDLEVWAGRWWKIAKESRPFTLTDGKCFCDYRPYFGQQGHDPANHPGFFAYEAWKIAKRQSDFWSGIPSLSEKLINAGGDNEGTK